MKERKCCTENRALEHLSHRVFSKLNHKICKIFCPPSTVAPSKASRGMANPGARMPASPPWPPEARRQLDGAMLLVHGDGTSTRWSQRANGIWRKPEKSRAAGRDRAWLKKLLQQPRRARQEEDTSHTTTPAAAPRPTRDQVLPTASTSCGMAPQAAPAAPADAAAGWDSESQTSWETRWLAGQQAPHDFAGSQQQREATYGRAVHARVLDACIIYSKLAQLRHFHNLMVDQAPVCDDPVGKLTGMLLEQDAGELVRLIEAARATGAMDSKVVEALLVPLAHHSQATGGTVSAIKPPSPTSDGGARESAAAPRLTRDQAAPEAGLATEPSAEQEPSAQQETAAAAKAEPAPAEAALAVAAPAAEVKAEAALAEAAPTAEQKAKKEGPASEAHGSKIDAVTTMPNVVDNAMVMITAKDDATGSMTSQRASSSTTWPTSCGVAIVMALMLAVVLTSITILVRPRPLVGSTPSLVIHPVRTSFGRHALSGNPLSYRSLIPTVQMCHAIYMGDIDSVPLSKTGQAHPPLHSII